MSTTSAAEAQKSQRGSAACTGHTDELVSLLREKAVWKLAVARSQWVHRQLIRELGPCCWDPSGLSILSPEAETLVLSMSHHDGTPRDSSAPVM